MSFASLLKAEFKLVYGEMVRRKSAFVAMALYPYLFAGFVLFAGYAGGSPQRFVERVGVDPVPFMVTASYMIMSILTCVDDVLWRPLSDYWVGTLAYVIASPVSRLKLFLAIPIPRLVLLLLTGLAGLVPVYVVHYGLAGPPLALVVMCIAALGALTMSTLSIAVAGVVHSVGESWRVLGVVRPILLILLGAYYPRTLMPAAARALSYLIPPSHAVEAVQRILLGAADRGVAMLLAASIAMAALYAPGSWRSIRYWERRKVAEGVRLS